MIDDDLLIFCRCWVVLEIWLIMSVSRTFY